MLVLAGSEGKSGAGFLTAYAALRTGVGLVTLASTQKLQSLYSSMLPCALTLGLPEREGEVSEDGINELLAALEKKKALVIGPGFGLGEGPKKILFTLIQKAKIPILLDADALTLLKDNLELIKNYPSSKVLTPHPGEAARLLGVRVEDILRDPLQAVETLNELTGAIVVLKGPHTIISSPERAKFISSTDEPGMAQGGMGDVLSGIISALMAQGYAPFQACALGVYLHGASAKYLRESKGPFGFTAIDVADNIPFVLKGLEDEKV